MPLPCRIKTKALKRSKYLHHKHASQGGRGTMVGIGTGTGRRTRRGQRIKNRSGRIVLSCRCRARGGVSTCKRSSRILGLIGFIEAGFEIKVYGKDTAYKIPHHTLIVYDIDLRSSIDTEPHITIFPSSQASTMSSTRHHKPSAPRTADASIGY